MKMLSLFDGIGCFPLAYSNVNDIDINEFEYDSSEIMPFLLDVIKTNFPKSHQLFNIEDIDISQLSADIVTMGTPCTGFSIAGKRDGLENIESKLFNNGVEVIKTIKPQFFVWENVFGVFTANSGKELKVILNEFKNIGYDCVWTVLDTKFFGLPQRRRRVYMIGVRDGIEENHNMFDFFKRMDSSLIKESKAFDINFPYDFSDGDDVSDYKCYFNRQRSDSFKDVGVASTIMKRDYKDFTDLIVDGGNIRRLSLPERLKLQGIPKHWFDVETQATTQQKYQANGMSVPVVEYVFEQLKKYIDGDRVSSDIVDAISGSSHTETLSDISDISTDKVMYSGTMRLHRDGSDNATVTMTNDTSEGPETNVKVTIDAFLDTEFDDKLKLSVGGAKGILRREIESLTILPKKLKESIFYMYPELIVYYNELIDNKEKQLRKESDEQNTNALFEIESGELTEFLRVKPTLLDFKHGNI